MNATGYSIKAIADAVGGQLFAEEPDRRIDRVQIDSRKQMAPDGTLFIAIHGERHDGHRYITDLIVRGVRDFMVAPGHERPKTVGAGLNFIVVKDSLDALQRVAAWHRRHFHIPVVGITGSNGKSVVKEWLFHLLHGHEHIVRSPGSWKSQVGVPLSIWQMHGAHTLGIFEAGISRSGEMDRLRAMIEPTIGIITNIGPAHGHGFRNDLHKAEEKLKLFANSEVLIHCADHAVVAEAVRSTGLGQRLREVTWGRHEPAWLHVVHEERQTRGTRITVNSDRHAFHFDVPFTDPASVENALHCVTLLLFLGHAPEKIAARTAQLPPVAMRLETVEGLHGTTLINDAYSNDPAALAVALEHLDQVAAGRPKAVVLSDMYGTVDPPAMRYQQVATMLNRSGVTRLLVVGPEISAARSILSGDVRAYASAEELIEQVDLRTLAGHAILVKGARSFALEAVVKRWQRQMHGTTLEVDMEAVRHNLNMYRSRLGPGVKVMAMVKANGYGAGAVELARLCMHEQVAYLGVAYADEGVELRQQGVDLPILVMNPEPVDPGVLYRFALEAEVYDEHSLRDALALSQLHADAPPVHIKLDTGMHRLGFGPDDLPGLLHLLASDRTMRVASILSHLAAGEDPAQDAFTQRQLETFTTMADAITQTLGYRPLRHIANSAAVVRSPETHLDMVRLGIGLHGLGHDPWWNAGLRAVATLRSPIAQIRIVPAGEGIGYGVRDTASSTRTIATLPIGYADGLPRRLGNGVGRILVGGRLARITGHVCMDMVMIDVTGIPCAVGDMATIFGPAHPVQEMARSLGTIPYEVLTGVAARVKRVHVHE